MKPPIALPQIFVGLGGSQIAADLLRLLVEVRVQSRISMPTLCELIFLDPQGHVAESGLTEIGQSFRVGIRGSELDLFSGDVTGVDHIFQTSRGREVRVRGYDVLNRLSRRQSVRSFVQMTLRDLVQELVSDLGLEVVSDASERAWEYVIQSDQTDLEFLAELADRQGSIFFVRDTKLYLTTLKGTDSTEVLRLGEELLEARFSLNEVTRYASVSTTGWDTTLAEVRTGSAKTPRVQEGVLTANDGASSDAERLLTNYATRSDEEATLNAQAELDYRAAQRLSLSGLAVGNPALRPGTPIRVQGVDSSCAGPFTLTAANHIISTDSGFVTEIDTSPMRPKRRRTGVSATLGLVSRTDDPQRLGRIQVSLPAFGNVATDWVQTVAPWAGKGKGFMGQTDVGDLVVFLFFDSDLTQGIVLGTLYGSGGPPEDWSKDDKGQRYMLVTPGGQKVRLDDSGSVIRLENARGSYVELSPDRVMVHSETDLHMEAPGKPIVISGKSIDFQQG